MEELSHLFYKDDHISCINYKSSLDSGFKYVNLREGQQVNSEFMPRHNLILLMSGTLSISCSKYPAQTLRPWEMILIPRAAKVDVNVMEDSAVVLFGFEVLLSTCDRIRYRQEDTLYKSIKYDFKPTEIRRPLQLFLNLLAHYLSTGLKCVHMHEAKHKELFLCLKAFYSKEEVAYLLYPMMHNAIDFRNIILENRDEFNCIDDMINATQMSRTRFFVRFKQEFGITAKQWMLKHQIDKIEHTAAIPNITTKKLMAEFGFNTTAQFVQFCRLHFSCTPNELIQRNRLESN